MAKPLVSLGQATLGRFDQSPRVFWRLHVNQVSQRDGADLGSAFAFHGHHVSQREGGDPRSALLLFTDGLHAHLGRGGFKEAPWYQTRPAVHKAILIFY